MSGILLAAWIWIGLCCTVAAEQEKMTPPTAPNCGEALPCELAGIRQVMNSIFTPYMAVGMGSCVDTKLQALDKKLERILTETQESLTDTKIRLTENEEKLKDTKITLTETQTRLTDTERRLTDTETRLTDTERRLTDTERRLTATETELNATKEKLTTAEARLEERHPAVAFSARYKGIEIVNVGSGGTVKFNQVITNVGDSYALHTGLFTAPYAGTYAFYGSLRSTNNFPWLHLSIYQGNNELVVFGAEGMGDHWDEGNGFVTAHLEKGDVVSVRQSKGGTMLEGGAMTTFSGMLLAVD